jgi:hypothetical protein
MRPCRVQTMIDLAAASHTNRELELMLDRRKPLAVFYDEISCLPNDEIIPEERFRPYVEEGLFVRAETILNFGFDASLGRDMQVKYVFFSLSTEAWRIPAFILVKTVALQTQRNSEEMERLESMLLGYTQEEVDAWCNHMYRRNEA